MNEVSYSSYTRGGFQDSDLLKLSKSIYCFRAYGTYLSFSLEGGAKESSIRSPTVDLILNITTRPTIFLIPL